eukprot:scaffold2162_cov398-Prasinococcus_capsulatus_cf.AAC.21
MLHGAEGHQSPNGSATPPECAALLPLGFARAGIPARGAPRLCREHAALVAAVLGPEEQQVSCCHSLVGPTCFDHVAVRMNGSFAGSCVLLLSCWQSHGLDGCAAPDADWVACAWNYCEALCRLAYLGRAAALALVRTPSSTRDPNSGHAACSLSLRRAAVPPLGGFPCLTGSSQACECR